MSNRLDRIHDFGFDYVLNWPLTVTEKSKSKLIRLIGLLVWLVWVFPGAVLSFPFLIAITMIEMFEYVIQGT